MQELPDPSQALAEPFGPAPFRFEPRQGTLSVTAFSPAFKILALAIVAGCGWWMYSLWSQGRLSSGSSSGIVWLLSGQALLVWTLVAILRSRTTLSATQLHQSWIFDKRLEVRDLAYARVIRIRGLDWLIAPRLYARTFMGKFAVFYAADPAMLVEFERLSHDLAQRLREGR